MFAKTWIILVIVNDNSESIISGYWLDFKILDGKFTVSLEFSPAKSIGFNKLPKTKKLVAPFDRGKSLGLLFFKKSDIMS